MITTPYIGDPRGASMVKTIQVFQNKIRKISALKGTTFLDVGCGDGSFTIPLSENYMEVTGMDVQQSFLDVFQNKVKGKEKFKVLNMSAEAMEFPDNSFDTIVTIETVEHIPDLNKAAKEFYRVLKPGAELIITCPNRFFPFENHGMRIGNKEIHTRIPLLPYIPFLHDKFSLARVFTVNSLDKLFVPLGFKKVKVDYIWPTFEHGGNVFSPMLRPLFKVMRRMEESWLRFFGTSILIRYVKE
ncbi:MAG TPA: class I SAM-dependent methyltransferase [Cyclobacteriaceae bacterium]|nr:class I SAM-dependent methyltransferase [Cyclobacteriaceae bacterium]